MYLVLAVLQLRLPVFELGQQLVVRVDPRRDLRAVLASELSPSISATRAALGHA